MPNGTTTRHRLILRKPLPLSVLVIIAAVALAWWWGGGEPSAAPPDGIEVAVVEKHADPEPPPPSRPPPPKAAAQTAQAVEQPPATPDVLTPGEVINNPECSVRTGRGQAEGLAAVTVPGPDGTRFSVLDGAGTVFHGEMPFTPDLFQIGKRRDGAVVVGFGDLKRGWEVDPPRPVRVYRDGSIIFESPKAHRLGVASDGSSFFVTEPLANDVSNLRIHNLDLGIEKHHELDQIGPYDHHEPWYLSKYTVPPTEVHFEHEDVYRTNWFYPVDGGAPRSLKMDKNVANRGVFASSRVGYFVRQGRDRNEKIIFKREFRHDGAGEVTSTEPWRRTLDLDGLDIMQLAGDGAWLILYAKNLHVLDAMTGETVFAFPTEVNLSRSVDPNVPKDWSSKHKYKIQYQMYREARFKRLANILPDDATADNVGGDTAGLMQIRGGLLIMPRFSRRSGWDIYDMSEIQLDSQPNGHLRISTEIECTAGNVPGRGLQEVDGKLTYLTERLAFDAE